MNGLKRQLTLKDGISLAFGSVIGSGILFLPSLTFSISGSYTMWVWIITTLLCIPLIYIFTDMVKEVPNESGIEGFVSLGLGKRIGATIPIIFLGTVSFGMSASALIVGEYVSNFLGGGIYSQLFTAFLIVFSGVIANLNGIKIGANVQFLITCLIFLVGVLLLIFAFPTRFGDGSMTISSNMISVIVPGIVVAFWAFAGFENLTFIAGEFKNPARDFKLSMLVALFLAGLLYLFLSESCASHIPQDKINPIAGLYQLSEIIHPKYISTLIITIFAFLAVQINFNSWIWGISRLIYSSAKKNKFPAYFAVLNNKHIPARAILLLATLFSIVLLSSIIFPDFLKTILIAVSTNFVFIYTLCLISYALYKKWSFLKIVSIGLLMLLVLLLWSSKWIALYPIFLFVVGLIINFLLYSSNADKTIEKNTKK